MAITICRLPRSTARCCGASSLGTGFVSTSANGSRLGIVEAEFLEQTFKKGTAAQRIVRSSEPSFAHVITIVCHDRRLAITRASVTDAVRCVMGSEGAGAA